MELQAVEDSEVHVYDEYLIEVVKQSRGGKYYTRLYKLVARGPPCANRDAALEESVNFVKIKDNHEYTSARSKFASMRHMIV